MSDYDDEISYDRYSAQQDADECSYERELQEILRPMVRAELHKRMEALIAADPEGTDESWDEDSLQEKIEEELRPEAEEILSEMDHDPYDGWRDR